MKGMFRLYDKKKFMVSTVEEVQLDSGTTATYESSRKKMTKREIEELEFCKKSGGQRLCTSTVCRWKKGRR